MQNCTELLVIHLTLSSRRLFWCNQTTF